MNVFRILLWVVVSLLLSASAVQAQVTPGDPGNFITTWNTENFGSSSNTEIEIPTTGSGYNYDVYWEEVGNASNNGTINGNTGDLTIDFLSEGIYRVEIAGDFPRIHFNFRDDRQKILTVEQWGDIAWTSMEDAFNGCTNLTIPATDAPDLSGVTNMEAMFRWATTLNNDISHWDVSNVENMQDLFNFANTFNQPLNSWNVEKVTNMRQMFADAAAFNQNLNSWDVRMVEDMRSMFNDASSFNGNISSWKPESATQMNSMFEGARDFNQDINGWDVSSVENMQSIFSGAFDFNQDLNDWDVSNVESMRDMFRFAASFDGDISNWNVSSVTDMHSMFSSAGDFNQDLSTKTVNAGTAQEYTAWDVSGVTIVNSMFQSADSFNRDLSSWDVSGLTNFGGMFSGADAFNQDLSAWDISGAEFMQNMLNNTGLSTENYDNTLIGWSAQPVKSGVNLGASGLTYCDAADDRQSLTDSPNNWTISDAGVATDCTAPSSPDVFVTTWETNISGSPTITIPIEGTGYNFSIDWGDGNSTNWQDGDPIGGLTHTYASSGIYKVEIDGDFPRIFFNNSGDRRKILTVEQWGTIEWSSMEYAFYGAENLEILAEDTPDLSNVTSMKGMFRDADTMNNNINDWETGNVQDMSELFMRAFAFNQPLNDWNTGMVTTMVSMFEDAEAFSQDLDNWDVRGVLDMSSMFQEAENFNGALNAWTPESVTNLQSMFEDAEAFNQPIDGWDTGSVENMAEMFRDAENFNQDLDSWDVS
ncbi:MAG: BspA family leucine-rich repeat surface protein, partial [Bacteroidetes bacterium]|nr:BspA family leucine-rich repeat surface protein [Bacteroidota bacterium]